MQLKSECSDIFEKFFPFWNSLPSSDKDLFCDHTFLTNYRKNENIHGGNGECTGGIIVKSGCIRAYILSEDGREITLYRLYPGDICMLSASCVIESISFDVIVDAEEDSEVYIVRGKTFKEISDRNLAVENFALNTAVHRFSEVMWVMQQILFVSFDKRLAGFLVDEMSKNKTDEIRLTHEQIAKYMGTAREVVSRMLKYFSTEGIVKLSRGGVKIIDKSKLHDLTV